MMKDKYKFFLRVHEQNMTLFPFAYYGVFNEG